MIKSIIFKPGNLHKIVLCGTKYLILDTFVENILIYKIYAAVHICLSVCPNSIILRYKVSSKLGICYNQSYAKNKKNKTTKKKNREMIMLRRNLEDKC